MKKFNLDEMTKGWFVGDFEPTVIRTSDCEVGVKRYQSGDKESAHFHKEALLGFTNIGYQRVFTYLFIFTCLLSL